MTSRDELLECLLTGDEWEPPEELHILLGDKALRKRDKVEAVVAFYAADHGGNAPTYQKIADILHDSKGNVYRYAMELTQPRHGPRAVYSNGKFWLVDSEYTHPVIRALFAFQDARHKTPVLE